MSRYFLLSLILLAIPAHAQHAEQTANQYCEPLAYQFGDIPGGLFRDDIPPERLDTVVPSLRLRVNADWARSIYFRHEGTEEHFQVFETGETSGFGKVFPEHLSGEICAVSQDNIKRPKVPFGGDVIFVVPENANGHPVSELADGLIDMRWRLVNLVPVSKFIANRIIRKNRYLHFIPLDDRGYYPDFQNTPKLKLHVRILKDGSEITSVPVIELTNTYAVKLSALKKSGADRIIVEGGRYEITGLPGIRSLIRELKKVEQIQQSNLGSIVLEDLEEVAEVLEPQESSDEVILSKPKEAVTDLIETLPD